MINRKFGKMFLTIAFMMFLCGVTVAQTPPDPSSHATPQLPQPKALRLDADFKLNAGAAATKERSVSLNFTASEKSDPGNVTFRDVTANVTHYRVLESPDLRPAKTSEQPWISIIGRPPVYELALRNEKGERYGERRVMFQVKTDILTSNTVSDTIVLEPVLKEYRVSASDRTHPLIKYAAEQGFTFPRSFYEACQSADCPGTFQADDSIATGSASVQFQASHLLLADDANPPHVSPLICVTKAEYQLFFGRSPNQFWRIKSVAVSDAHVVPHGVNRFLAKITHENKTDACLPPAQISVGDVIVEGPEVDDFIDPANPWKNAFVRQP